MSASEHCCDAMTHAVSASDVPVIYRASFREWGVSLVDGGTSALAITFCPWCGERLPASLRAAWFDRVESLGLEPGDPEIPIELASDRWWNCKDIESGVPESGG
jgi:hypothetical protein